MRVCRPVAVAAALVLSAGVLVGCGEEEQPEPTFEPTPSETVSESPSPSESPSAMEEPTPPPEMEGKGEKAAEAFVEYYFELFDYASLTGNVRLLKKQGVDACSACNGVVNTVRRVYSTGGEVHGGDSQLGEIVVESRGELEGGNRPYGVLVDVHVEPQRIQGTGSSALDGRFPARDFQVRADIVHSEQGWRMLSWEEL